MFFHADGRYMDKIEEPGDSTASDRWASACGSFVALGCLYEHSSIPAAIKIRIVCFSFLGWTFFNLVRARSESVRRAVISGCSRVT